MALICNRTRNQVSMKGWNIHLLIGQSLSVTIYNVIHTGQKPDSFRKHSLGDMEKEVL